MGTHPRQTVTPQLVIGVFITLIGALLILDLLVEFDAGFFRPIWPSVLIAIGVAMLMQRRDASGRFWGTVWTVLGTWLLLNALEILELRLWELIGPVLLIVIGWNIVRRTMTSAPTTTAPALSETVPPPATIWDVPGVPPDVPPIPDPASGRYDATSMPRTHEGGRVNLIAVLGETRRASNDRPFRGGEMTAVMGGCNLDLRHATLPAGVEARLNLLGLMAGHEIRVPAGWSVISDVIPIMGGVDDKRISPVAAGEDAPRLRLTGFIVMGGVVIKN